MISITLKEVYYCDLGITLDSWSTKSWELASVSPSHLAYRPLTARSRDFSVKGVERVQFKSRHQYDFSKGVCSNSGSSRIIVFSRLAAINVPR